MTLPEPMLRNILENPADDGPRLVAADWLEEAGECDRAEFIRVQCELALFEAWSDGKIWVRTPRGTNPDALRSREAELLAEHEAEWTWNEIGILDHESVRPFLNVDKFENKCICDTARFIWHRGFVSQAEGRLIDWRGEPCGRCGGLARGDVVRAVGDNALACGSGIYRHAIVVSANPLILVSEAGDMLWSRQQPNQLEKTWENSNPHDAFKRWHHDRSQYQRDWLNDNDKCPICHGIGRTGGLGPILVRRAPIERVVVTDKTCMDINHLWVWGNQGTCPQDQANEPAGFNNYLPDDVWKKLDGNAQPPRHSHETWCWFDSADAANRALSEALLAEARGVKEESTHVV